MQFEIAQNTQGINTSIADLAEERSDSYGRELKIIRHYNPVQSARPRPSP